MVKPILSLVVVASALSITAPARGQAAESAARVTEDEARELFFLALEEIREEKWALAERHLRASLGAANRSSTLYNLALVLYKQGRLVESLRLARQLLERTGKQPDDKYRGYGERLVERALSELPRVELAVRPADARIAIDGRATGGTGAHRTLTVDPGRREVSASREGYRPQRATLVLRPSDRRQLDFVLEPAATVSSVASARPEPRRASARSVAVDEPRQVGPMPWILIGTGGALLGASVVTAVFAERADARFEEGCPSLEQCDPDLKSTQDRARSFGLATDVLLLSGGALALGGLGWWLLAPAPSGDTVATAAPVLSHEGGGVFVSGRF